MKKTIFILLLLVLMVGIYTTLGFKIKADVEASKQEEIVEPLEIYTSEELIEMSNEYSVSMGFNVFEDAVVEEKGKNRFLISSEKENQIVVIWYDYEDGVWKVDYEYQPYVRTF